MNHLNSSCSETTAAEVAESLSFNYGFLLGFGEALHQYRMMLPGFSGLLLSTLSQVYKPLEESFYAVWTSWVEETRKTHEEAKISLARICIGATSGMEDEVNKGKSMLAVPTSYRDSGPLPAEKVADLARKVEITGQFLEGVAPIASNPPSDSGSENLTKPVTARTLLRRINRCTIHEDLVYRVCRYNSPDYHELGRYFEHDLATGGKEPAWWTTKELEAFARRANYLKEDEHLT